MKDNIARREKVDPSRVDPEREELKMERDVLKRSVVPRLRRRGIGSTPHLRAAVEA